LVLVQDPSFVLTRIPGCQKRPMKLCGVAAASRGASTYCEESSPIWLNDFGGKQFAWPGRKGDGGEGQGDQMRDAPAHGPLTVLPGGELLHRPDDVRDLRQDEVLELGA
jgi:hypothetical protein